jgi:regulator of replication initiation timing
LQLEELSLVDRPANAQAMVSLFKRDNSEEEVEKMTDEMEAKVKAYMKEKGCGKPEAMKALGYNDMAKAEETEVEETTEVDTLKSDLERLTASEAALREENERLRKGLIEEGYVISAEAIEKKAPVEMINVEGEMVAKADIPAPVLKALEAAEVAKKEHEIEKADIELTKKAEETLPHFDVNVAKALVKSFSEEEAIMAALVAADKAFEAAMQEFGKSDVDGEFATSADKLDNLVKRYMDENNMKKSEYAKAYAAVAKTDDGKALINKSYKGE